MGLEVGLKILNKELFYSFNGDEEAYYKFFEENDYTKYGRFVYSQCGWDNPVEKWFKTALSIDNNLNGTFMRPLIPYDIYAVINEAWHWNFHNVTLKPVAFNRAFNDNGDGTLTLIPVDGLEVCDDNVGAYYRFYGDSSEGRLFMVKDWIDPWYINSFPNFVHAMMEILSEIDWENEVLLYYISY